MRKEYIPVATSATNYYEPQTQQKFDQLMEQMKVGDMIFNKWVFETIGGLWYTMGLMDENNPDTKMLFPNIIMDEPLLENGVMMDERTNMTSKSSEQHELLKPLSRWGMARMDYLKEHNKSLAAEMGAIELHKHCLEIEEQARQHKLNMMEAIRKDPANKVTERDKAADPMAWVGRMNNYQTQIHETIYSDLIYV